MSNANSPLYATMHDVRYIRLVSEHVRTRDDHGNRLPSENENPVEMGIRL